MKTRTKARVVWTAVLSSAIGALLFCPRSFAQNTQQQGSTINTVSLNFTSAQLDPLEGNSVLRAFIPTGSTSVNCLVSLNEIGTNAFPAGISAFCGERAPFAFGGVPGVLVSVFFPQPAPPDLVLSMTLYQKGAQKYGPPVLCTANDGC
jgi:hypothetical protein